MKKINYKRILIVLAWVSALSGLSVSLAFVSKEQKAVRVKQLNVTVEAGSDNQFIDESGVKDYFKERNDEILNTPLNKIDLYKLEKALNAHPAIENAEVNSSMNGEVSVKVTPRVPIVRVVTNTGESYYIDRQHKLMPLSDNYTARVLIASGNINESYASRYTMTVDEIKAHQVFREVSLLDDVLEVTEKINGDTLLAQMIHQVFVNKDKELELFPAIGNHRIVLGDTENLDEKLNKLKLFYKQGLSKTNNWSKYSVLNLKYKNLVVCTSLSGSKAKK